MDATINASFKRYRYTGKERDDESGLYYHGARYYIPWLCRWSSPDPINNEWYNALQGKPERNKERSYVELTASPYEYSYDNPIMYNDPNGEQPPQKKLEEYGVGSWFGQGSNVPVEKPATQPYENNLKKPGLKEVGGIASVMLIYRVAVDVNFLANFGSRGYLSSEGIKTKPNSDQEKINKYRTDNTTDEGLRSAVKLNLYVNQKYISNVSEKQANRFFNYEIFVVTDLLTGLVSGTGPENYNFPTNGIISSAFTDSHVMDVVYKKYLDKELKFNKEFQISFKGKELADDTKRNYGNIINITGFVGSATVTVNPSENGYKIKIFNITSLSSGSLTKFPSEVSTFPRSYVREPNKRTTFGNISQTFNLFIPYTNPLLIHNK